MSSELPWWLLPSGTPEVEREIDPADMGTACGLDAATAPFDPTSVVAASDATIADRILTPAERLAGRSRI